jgi:hypothetical protein
MDKERKYSPLKLYRLTGDSYVQELAEELGYLWLYVKVDGGLSVFKSVATGETRYFMFPDRAFTEAADGEG